MNSYEYRDNLGNPRDYYDIVNDATKLCEEIEEKDKEIERLKAREQECIDKYLAESKYRGEIEGKYVHAKYVIDELEKDIQKEIDRTNDLILEDSSMVEINNIRKMLNETRQCILFKIKELKEGK